MMKKKPRKFVDGGFTDLKSGVGPLSLSMRPNYGGSSGGAYGGLETVNKGSQQIGQSLETIGSALGNRGTAPVGGLGILNNVLSGTAMKKGGKVSSASKRADGCAIRGKTRA